MLKNTQEKTPIGPVVNVAFYCRVSTDRQAEKEDGSLDTQLDRPSSLVEYRRRQGDNWVVAEKLVEGEKDGRRRGKSAKNTDRPAYQKLLELARPRLVDVVAVTKLDRISRSLSEPVICHMLRSPIYAARQEHEGKLYDAGWEPIRPWETHQKIQRLMDRNNHRKHGGKSQSRNYVYLLQGLLRCGECGHKMVPQPATGRNGIPYHYYGCNRAEKSVCTACPKRHVPAEAIDGAVLAFMKELHLKPERVKAIAAKENSFASDTIAKLKTDYERVSTQLGKVKQQLAHLAEVIANGGMSALATIKDKLEALEAERAEMEATQARLKAELEAEESQGIAVEAHVKSLAIFDAIIREHGDEPERLKSAVARFVDWHGGDKGEGQLEVSLFAHPAALSPEAVEYDSALHGAGRCFVPESEMVGRRGLEPLTFCVSSRRSSQLS